MTSIETFWILTNHPGGQAKFLGAFCYLWRNSHVAHRYTTDYAVVMPVCGFFVAETLFGQDEAADSVFTDAAEVQRAVAFDDVCYLRVAVGGAVLQVFDDAA